MGLEKNEHVERLAQYQPFDASFSQLFAEYVDTKSSDQLQTRALTFVRERAANPNCRLIVLTGDAGHGKTHLCGQFLDEVWSGQADVRQLLNEHADGRTDLATLPSGKKLRVVKDLSELDQEVAAEVLADALQAQHALTIVCANEGRLREAISRKSRDLGSLLHALEVVLETGQTSADGSTHVLNLNHQSVAGHGDRSLLRQALRNWVADSRKWARCDRCDAQSRCPILENRRLLADNGDEGERRRNALASLLRIVEQTNHTVTIRELLVFVAHTVTGGLRCPDVHDHCRRRSQDDWQHTYAFHQAAFGTRLGERERAKLEVFRATHLLDPGQRALRQVDDPLQLEANADVGRFVPRVSDEPGSQRTREQQRKAATERLELYRFLRRRDFFNAVVESSPAHSERLGFRHYEDFERILNPDASEEDRRSIRNLLLSGLEALQGARRPVNNASFYIIDPAFSSHRGPASVVATAVTKGKVRVLSQTRWWEEAHGSPPDLASGVDWLDRRVFVVMPDARGASHAIDLDLRQFELVCRAGTGLVSREFFQADIRRIVARLAGLAAVAEPAEEITVLVQGKPTKLVIDVGNVILAAES